MKKRLVLVICLLILLLNISWIFILNSPIETTGYSILRNFFYPVEIITSVGRVFIDVLFQVNVQSPLNATYNFNLSGYYTLDLNVSSNRNITQWRYTLRDLKHNLTINSSVLFSPNTTISAVRWSNELIVQARDHAGNFKNQSVVFSINVSNSAPVIGYVPSIIYVCENNYFSSLFNVTDIDEDNLDVDISPDFYTRAYANINYTTNTYEIFSGVLGKSYVGVNNGSKNYSETISASDGQYSDSRGINITIIEINNAPSITNIGVHTIWGIGANRTFYYKVNVSDIEDGNQDSGNLSFNISFSGARLFNISTNGIMNFSANSSQLGVYNITVCSFDRGIRAPHANISLCSQGGSNQTSCNSFSLTVTDQNRAPQIISHYPVSALINASEGQSLYFNISTYDPDGTIPDAYWYYDNIVLEYDNGSLVNSFSYTLDYNSEGNHTVLVKITDGILNSSYDYFIWNISVSDVSPPSSAAPSALAGGGGGGRVIARINCTEKWGCEKWSSCKNLKKNYGAGEIKLYSFSLIKERCSIFNWTNERCGYQSRNCTDFNYCYTNKTKPGVLKECYYTEHPSCTDRLLNCHDGYCEVLADCGGPCPSCPTCSDGIQNQNEEEVDCGGPCKACTGEIPMIKAKKGLVFLFLVIFILGLIIIIASMINYYKTEKKVKKEITKKQAWMKAHSRKI